MVETSQGISFPPAGGAYGSVARAWPATSGGGGSHYQPISVDASGGASFYTGVTSGHLLVRVPGNNPNYYSEGDILKIVRTSDDPISELGIIRSFSLRRSILPIDQFEEPPEYLYIITLESDLTVGGSGATSLTSRGVRRDNFDVEEGDDFYKIIKLTGHQSFEARTSKMHKKINVYSFALKPEEHQPSGTCNFSRIDNAELITGSALESTDNIYAVNYNVLRIMSGMGGLAYSN